MEKAKRILVVDDEADMRRIISVRLEINGYDVITAEDGEDALNKAKGEKPDLIVLDLMLPKISGFEVCRMLKFDEKYKTIPIVILSALDQQADREKADKCGADAYFIKPFDFELFIKKTKDLLRK